MLRRFAVTVAVALGLAASPLAAQEAPPPKLVVAISVDQFSADLFAQYRDKFTGGLARLLTGAVFPSGYQSHAATETCPGHSTLLTGVRPGRNGIIANDWYDLGAARDDKRIYCSEDEALSGKPYVPSAIHLLVPTLGERLKAAVPGSRNIAVSGKDRGALMMGGTNTDEVYFWLDTRFRTVEGRSEPAEVAATNAQVDRMIKAGIKPYALPAWCAATDRPIVAGSTTVGSGRLALKAGDNPSNLRRTPQFDRLTLGLAQALVTNRGLGKGPAPDVLSVSLSANDYVGHSFGTNGAEMCIQVHELDKALGDFFVVLDRTGVDYVAVLSADHGGFDTVERLDEQGLPQAQRVDARLTPRELGRTIGAKLGIQVEGPLLVGGTGGDLWISRAVTPAQKLAVVQELKALERTDPQVAAVFTAEELAGTPMPKGQPDEWTLAQRARASFHAPRSGDVVVLLARNVVPIPNPGDGYTATHGSPWNYDRRVPILFWRKGMRHFEQPAAIETVDIAPSLAGLLKLHVPEGEFDGRCIDLDSGPGDSCAR